MLIITNVGQVHPGISDMHKTQITLFVSDLITSYIVHHRDDSLVLDVRCLHSARLHHPIVSKYIMSRPILNLKFNKIHELINI